MSQMTRYPVIVAVVAALGHLVSSFQLTLPFEQNRCIVRVQKLRPVCNPHATKGLVDGEDGSILWEEAPSRRHVVGAAVAAVFATTILSPFWRSSVEAFDGGIGGLGKTKPDTGVVFRNTESRQSSYAGSSSFSPWKKGGNVTNELLAPDGTPALVSFYAPWPMLGSTSGIESRDLANPEAAFVQVGRVSSTAGGKNGRSDRADSLPPSFFERTIFSPTGKFGAYGAPVDVKVKNIGPTVVSVSTGHHSVEDDSVPSTYLYAATFTTFTPAMRESERKVYVSTSIVGDAVFMLVTGTTVARFKAQEKLLKSVADSFVCVAAPKSGLRSRS